MRTNWMLGFLALAMLLVSSDLARAATPGPVDKDAPEEFTTTKSGLKYRIRRKSDGDKPKPANNVTVHYKGWLDNGRSSTARMSATRPFRFRSMA
jgi:FKBP-type peptidyl-prolyl cis-trans isomerase FkpA